MDNAGVEGGAGHAEGRSISDGREERSVVFEVMLGAESMAVGAARVDVPSEVARDGGMPSLHSVESISTDVTFENVRTHIRTGRPTGLSALFSMGSSSCEYDVI